MKAAQRNYIWSLTNIEQAKKLDKMMSGGFGILHVAQMLLTKTKIFTSHYFVVYGTFRKALQDRLAPY